MLARALVRRGLPVERRKAIGFELDGLWFEEGLRVDLLASRLVVIELKPVEEIARVHSKQVLI